LLLHKRSNGGDPVVIRLGSLNERTKKMTAPTCQWQGASGARYIYHVHTIGTGFKCEPGNYIFAKATPGGWLPIYIGESESLGDRCCRTHEKWDLAIRHGATHIHCHLTANKNARLSEETDLVREWSTPCNHQ
jgi:hypothetical protein